MKLDLYVGDWDIKSIEIDSKYLRFFGLFS